MEAAVVLVEAGDRNGFHRLARAMLEQFAESMDSSVVERTAKVNLLIPPPADELKRAGALAQRSVDLGEGNGLIGWFQLVRGMSAYRSGEFATAVEWLDKASKSNYAGEHSSTWKSYLAVAEFGLGHGERARSPILEAGELIAVRAAQKDVGDSWHDLWIADMARREAEGLMNPAPSQATKAAKP